MTVSNKTLYSLVYVDSQPSLIQTRLTYNLSSASSLSMQPQTPELAFVFPSDQLLNCKGRQSALNMRYPNLYIVCFSENYPDDNSPRLLRINIETKSFSQASIQLSKNTDRLELLRQRHNPWSLMAISESMLLLVDNSDQFPRHLHHNNPNPDMSRSPLTLSDLESVLITVAALVLALLHIWIKEQILKRKMRKWKGEDWFEEDDIPGSKLAEEMDEETFQAYQRQEQERIQRHLRENGDQIENEHRIYSDGAVSTSLDTTNVHRRSSPNNNNLNNLSSSRDVLTQEIPAPSSLFRADGLEQLGFSSHPRPNVVTTIPDDGSEE
ncbi:hypothetical protein BGZ83_002341 [Gryganskiella cystojenkinii]|nr:hypothetical protein BGZ83_002341 [Gryganskiella cystojenkinii]